MRTSLNARGLLTATVHEASGYIVVVIPSSAVTANVTAWERNQLAAAVSVEEVPDNDTDLVPTDPVHTAIVTALAGLPVSAI